MYTFTEWLLSGLPPESDAHDILVEFQKNHPKIWAKAGNNRAALKQELKNQYPADPDQLEKLNSALDLLWTQWGKNTPVKRKGFFAFVGGNVAGTIGILVATVFLVVLAIAFVSETGILARVNDVATARGAITFLFAFATVVLALMLVAAALFSTPRDEDDSEYLTKQFNHGKEILTILIGILGTIVGFYFGTQENNSQAGPLTLSEIQISSELPAPGSSITIGATLGGGKAPYSINLDFDDKSGIEDQRNIKSSDGFLVKEVVIPSALQSTEFLLIMTAEDRLGIRKIQLKNIKVGETIGGGS